MQYFRPTKFSSTDRFFLVGHFVLFKVTLAYPPDIGHIRQVQPTAGWGESQTILLSLQCTSYRILFLGEKWVIERQNKENVSNTLIGYSKYTRRLGFRFTNYVYTCKALSLNGWPIWNINLLSLWHQFVCCLLASTGALVLMMVYYKYISAAAAKPLF